MSISDAASPWRPRWPASSTRIIDGRAVRAVFQPLIDLASGDVVGFEALARGPAGSMLESPGALFEAAYGIGRVAELDWVCRAAAFQAAARAEPRPGPAACSSTASPPRSGCPARPDL